MNVWLRLKNRIINPFKKNEQFNLFNFFVLIYNRILKIK